MIETLCEQNLDVEGMQEVNASLSNASTKKIFENVLGGLLERSPFVCLGF